MYIQEWNDAWSEMFGDDGVGKKMCNKWKRFASGAENIERSGEDWDAKNGWFQKGCDCNTLQHTATHCTTLQHTITHCNTLL